MRSERNGLPLSKEKVFAVALLRGLGSHPGLDLALTDDDYAEEVALRKKDLYAARKLREERDEMMSLIYPKPEVPEGMQSYVCYCPVCKKRYTVVLREGLTWFDTHISRSPVPCKECYDIGLKDYAKQQAMLNDATRTGTSCDTRS